MGGFLLKRSLSESSVVVVLRFLLLLKLTKVIIL